MIEGATSNPPSVLIIGAGPYGLSAASFLSAAGAEVHIHGKPMASWIEKMPERMILRSTRVSSSIASPGDSFSIVQYEKQTGAKVDFQPTIGQFIAYAQWFQKNAVPQVDETRIQSVKQDRDGFISTLEDGRVLHTHAVVMAIGISLFPYVPEEFSDIPEHLASHVSAYTTFDSYRDKDVVVIGKGQSGLESAALLHECGAKVEIITRGPNLKFIKKNVKFIGWDQISSLPAVHQFLYPPTDLAGPPYNWVIADPLLYRRLSKAHQARSIELVGPIGSGYLENRLAGVRVTTQATVKHVQQQEQKICITLSDGTNRLVDHVLLATGFRPDINRCDFLSDEFKSSLAQEDGYPMLTLGYESTTVKGFYILGALAFRSQGPINRFVCGTYPVSQYLTEAITGSRLGYPNLRTSRHIAGRRLLFRIYQMLVGR